MAKITLASILTAFASALSLNNRFSDIEEHLNDKVLYRDNPSGEPNQMKNDLDMNSNKITNLPSPISDAEPARWGDVKDGVAGITELVPSAVGNEDKALSSNGTDLAYKKATFRQDTVASMLADTTVVLGQVWACEDYATGNNAGLLHYTVVGAATGTADGGAFLDHDTLNLQFARLFLQPVTVKDFGAVGDGTTDDILPIQAAVDYADSLRFPNDRGEQYLISDSIALNAEDLNARIREGIHLYADVSSRDDKQVIKVKTGSAIEAVIQILDGVSVNNILTNCSLDNISIDGNGESVFGIACGKWGSTINQLVKMFHTENLSIKDCRIGYLIGGAGVGIETDSAGYSNTNTVIEDCDDGAVLVDTGNGAAISFTGPTFNGNGFNPTTDSYNSGGEGFHTKTIGGEINLLAGTDAGSGATKPVTAAHITSSADIRVNGMWSDTNGIFLKDSGSSNASSFIHGLRHNQGSMTAGNTPVSIEHTCKLVVTGSLLYGVIESNEGNSGSITTEGVNFVSGGAAAANSTAYTGTLKTNQKGVLSLNNFGNRAQIAIGGGSVDMAHKGAYTPQLLQIGAGSGATGPTAVRQVLGPASTDSGYTETLDTSTGSQRLFINCYEDDTTGKVAPILTTKDSHIIDIGGGTFEAFKLRRHKFTSSTPVTKGTFQTVFTVLQGATDGTLDESAIVPPKLAANPTFNSGDYWEGGLYYNTTSNKLRVNTGGSTWADLH